MSVINYYNIGKPNNKETNMILNKPQQQCDHQNSTDTRKQISNAIMQQMDKKDYNYLQNLITKSVKNLEQSIQSQSSQNYPPEHEHEHEHQRNGYITNNTHEKQQDQNQCQQEVKNQYNSPSNNQYIATTNIKNKHIVKAHNGDNHERAKSYAQIFTDTPNKPEKQFNIFSHRGQTNKPVLKNKYFSYATTPTNNHKNNENQSEEYEEYMVSYKNQERSFIQSIDNYLMSLGRESIDPKQIKSSKSSTMQFFQSRQLQQQLHKKTKNKQNSQLYSDKKSILDSDFNSTVIYQQKSNIKLKKNQHSMIFPENDNVNILNQRVSNQSSYPNTFTNTPYQRQSPSTRKSMQQKSSLSIQKIKNHTDLIQKLQKTMNYAKSLKISNHIYEQENKKLRKRQKKIKDKMHLMLDYIRQLTHCLQKQRHQRKRIQKFFNDIQNLQHNFTSQDKKRLSKRYQINDRNCRNTMEVRGNQYSEQFSEDTDYNDINNEVNYMLSEQSEELHHHNILNEFQKSMNSTNQMKNTHRKSIHPHQGINSNRSMINSKKNSHKNYNNIRDVDMDQILEDIFQRN